MRTAIIDLSACSAYRKKSAESTDYVKIDAGGYSTDRSNVGPNWSKLAESMMGSVKAKLKLYAENPLNGITITPAIKFVAYRLNPYVPQS